MYAVIHAKHRNRLPLPQPAVVHVRRSYAESRYGQIHLATAYPSGGGFDEKTPLVCLHHAGGSAKLFTPILRDVGHDRSVYALDLPGHGTSDTPTARYTVADLASAVGDFLDSLRLRAVDLFGHELGALISAELAIARPQQVRKVLLWGVPLYTAQERTQVLQQPTRLGAREDGGDVIEEWRRMLEHRGPGVPMPALADELADRLRAGPSTARSLAAAVEYQLNERLPLVKQPTQILRVRDEFWEHAPRVRAVLPNSSLLDLGDYGRGFLSAAPQKFAAIAREFLDR